MRHARRLVGCDLGARAPHVDPWYVNRAPKAAELDAGDPTILRVLQVAVSVKVVLLQGGDAANA